MRILSHALVGVTLVMAACQSYRPEPIDLAMHAQEFAARLPASEAVREYVAVLQRRLPETRAYDPTDGIDLHEARLLALLFNPELRAARLRAGVARASRDYAGLWTDPALSVNFARILESVAHPWIVVGDLDLTIPITGRPGLARELAGTQLALAWTEARAAESRILAELDLRFVEWATSREQERLLVEMIERLRPIEEIAQRLSEAQEITSLEARPFTLERVSREADLLRQRALVADAELALKQLLGLAPTAPVAFQPTLAIELRIGDPATRAASTSDGPRLAIRAREYEVAERSLALAVRKQWPELALAPGWQEEDAQPRAALGFSLPLPLWNGNRREIAETRAERALAGERLRAEIELAIQDLARAEVRLQSAKAQRTQLEGQLVPLVDQQVAEGRRVLELGRLDTLLLLDGLVRSQAAKSRVLDAVLAEAQATAQVNSFFWPSLLATNDAEQSR